MKRVIIEYWEKKLFLNIISTADSGKLMSVIEGKHVPNTVKQKAFERAQTLFNEATGRTFTRCQIRRLYHRLATKCKAAGGQRTMDVVDDDVLEGIGNITSEEISNKVQNLPGINSRTEEWEDPITGIQYAEQKAALKSVARGKVKEKKRNVLKRKCKTFSSSRVKPGAMQFQWMEYEASLGQAFRDLRSSQTGFDITLVCDDGVQVQAHKLILSVCSPFLKEVINAMPHHHPFMFLKGIESGNLESVMDYMYNGKAVVPTSDLKSFITTAADLRVKGLSLDLLEQNLPEDYDEGSSEEKIKRDHPELIQTRFLEKEERSDQVYEKIEATTVKVEDPFKGHGNSFGEDADDEAHADSMDAQQVEIDVDAAEGNNDDDAEDEDEDDDDDDDEDDDDDDKDDENDGTDLIEHQGVGFIKLASSKEDPSESHEKSREGSKVKPKPQIRKFELPPPRTPGKKPAPKICTICGANFGTSTIALMIHRSREHSVPAPKCELCATTFATPDFLKKHMETAHGFKVDS